MSKLDEMQAALAPAKKDGYTVTQTLYDSLEASLTAANERIKLVESEAIANEHIARNLENKLAAEREVSDKLEKALTGILGWIDDWCETSDGDFQTLELAADAALAEVAALRKKDRE